MNKIFHFYGLEENEEVFDYYNKSYSLSISVNIWFYKPDESIAWFYTPDESILTLDFVLDRYTFIRSKKQKHALTSSKGYNCIEYLWYWPNNKIHVCFYHKRIIVKI